MPKKGKKGKKKKSPEEEAAEKAEMERLLLADHCQSTLVQKEDEEAKYNEYLLQKDKLNHFWIIAKKDLEDRKSTLRNKERELQDADERMQVEIKELKQRVKHLLFEHYGEATKSKTDGVVSLKLTQDAQRESEAELREDLRAMEAQLREREAAHEARKRDAVLEHNKALTRMRLSFEQESRELAAQYETVLAQTRRELFQRRQDQVRRVEERKAKHIARLLQAHDQAFADIRSYYGDITQANMDMIKSKKEEVAELTKKEAADEKRIVGIAQENKRMSAPLARALEESRRLRQERDTYLEELEQLRGHKEQIVSVESRVNALRWEHELLRQRHGKLRQERDDLQKKFVGALYDVQQKSGFRRLLLEKKLDAAGDELEKKMAQLGETLRQADLEPDATGQVEEGVDAMVRAKDDAVAELEGELRRVEDRLREVVGACETRLQRAGVKTDELGFRHLLDGPSLPPGAGAGPGEAPVPAMTGTRSLGEAVAQAAVRRTVGAGAGSTARAGAAAGGAGGRGAGGGTGRRGGRGRDKVGAAAASAAGPAPLGHTSRLGIAARRAPGAADLPGAMLDPRVALGGPKAAAAVAQLRGGAGGGVVLVGAGGRGRGGAVEGKVRG